MAWIDRKPREGETTWADALKDQLRTLWSEGHSTAEIGRRLGVSKNAAVGKARRMDLPPRPSPIRRGGERPVQPAHRNRAVTLPSLPSTAAAAVNAPPAAPRPLLAPFSLGGGPNAMPTPRRPPQPAPAPATQHAQAAAPVQHAVGRGTCQWPITDGRPWRFCGDPVRAGSPSWCEEHFHIVFPRVRDRREEAA